MSIRQGSNIIAAGSSSNASINSTNCLTNIPQTIKIESKFGGFVLKAGSKLYYLDGSVKTIQSDIDYTLPSGRNGNTFLVMKDNTILCKSVEAFSSGNSNDQKHVLLHGEGFFFNTETNKVYYSANIDPMEVINWEVIDMPLPIGTVNFLPDRVVDKIYGIDQVFNGYGYVGLAVYVLPGFKGLVSDGLVSDGSYRNRVWNNSSVLVYNRPRNVRDELVGLFYDMSSGSIRSVMNYYIQDSLPQVNFEKPSALDEHTLWLDTSDNYTYCFRSPDMDPSAYKRERVSGIFLGWVDNAKHNFIGINFRKVVAPIEYDSMMVQLLNTLYPVGSVYITSANVCPLQLMHIGEWVIADIGIITGVDSIVKVRGNGKSLSLTDGKSYAGFGVSDAYNAVALKTSESPAYGNVGQGVQITKPGSAVGGNVLLGVDTDPTRSGMVGDVTSKKLEVFIYQRIG